MREILSTITSKGQVTVPKDVRARLGLAPHDKLAFILNDDGTVVLRAPKYPTVASLAGSAGSLSRDLSWDEIRETAREDHLADQLRSQRP